MGTRGVGSIVRTKPNVGVNEVGNYKEKVMLISPVLRSADDGVLIFWCPACNRSHAIRHGQGSGPRWTWDGNAEKPTFNPSILARWTEPSDNPDEFDDQSKDIKKICHSFIRAGNIEFCSDSTHALAGKTVPLAEWPKHEEAVL